MIVHIIQILLKLRESSHVSVVSAVRLAHLTRDGAFEVIYLRSVVVAPHCSDSSMYMLITLLIKVMYGEGQLMILYILLWSCWNFIPKMSGGRHAFSFLLSFLYELLRQSM